ncbi:polyphosphate polymerase domain-containing protein [Ruminococcus sp. 5_1_39BFAA]|uniref:polyphosphate polymerase domain-containing protein n=1 Tax=Ruminococcus sp. 5_1_39BFAA TaxID=457412 RepID=UPI0035675744
MEGFYRKPQQYRNEWKYFISLWEARLLRERLLPFMETDPYAVDGKYMIRSLYFDDYWNSAYEEKMMGVGDRQKWRIRIYNYNDSRIKLERKMKQQSYIHKDSASITREEFDRIMEGDYSFLLHHRHPLCQEFYYECMVNLYRPKVIVDYEREPLILKEGDVRITFDSDVRAAISSFDIFDPDLPTLDVLEPDKLVLEVKFTEFLPGLIHKLLPLNGLEFLAVSKYTLCYERAHHLTDVMAGISKQTGGMKR